MSSDDEIESLPDSVSDYDFQDEERAPISFSVLPLHWTEDDLVDGSKSPVFLEGYVDNGLQKIYKTVTAWKFELSGERPVMSVLLKQKNWIRLQKPRKSYEERIRSILVTVHCLHFVKMDPYVTQKSIWDHLEKTFSLYDARPSQNDLLPHTNLIKEVVARDKALENSMFLLSFLSKGPQRSKEPAEISSSAEKAGFIVYEDLMDDMGNDESEDDEELFDPVCAICDNGGDLLCCDGKCLRSFHATEDAGDDSVCDSLGFTGAEVEAMPKFFCANCQYKKHQCFCCGKLGSSDKLSGAAEVFSCVNATCGRFYHPKCVAKLLQRDDELAAADLHKKISAGESFACPIHKCHACKKGENKKVHDLQFAVCRRCPKSYHRKCLPSKIAFEDDPDKGIIQRAWEDLLPNRILIYCLKHAIIDDIGTPVRDHIKFPAVREKVKERGSVIQKRKSADKSVPETQRLSSAGSRSSSIEPAAASLKKRRQPELRKKMKKSSVECTKTGKKKKASASPSSSSSVHDASVPSLGDKLYALYNNTSSVNLSSRPEKIHKKPKLSLLDTDGKKMIMELMRDSTSCVTLENVAKNHKVPSTHSSLSKGPSIDKTITHGKIEGSVVALRTALRKLEGGGTVEDAKAVCEPEVLHQIVRWKNKLKVYLAPFLHGMRYTSYGRHFTKVDKLQEVVDKLHHYILDGDMIVDFCCGANDFSRLMRAKLEETGKRRCQYKNFDIIQPKDDFNFEKRDWMTVTPQELPLGSRLIMGLNPPFGVKAGLANQFVDHALLFKPKLVILIVPPETQGLDAKRRSPYDLLWCDKSSMSGKSFYLPGSVDAKDKQIEQWNLMAPVLSLWSRPDWTGKHKLVGHKCGHVITEGGEHVKRETPDAAEEAPTNCQDDNNNTNKSSRGRKGSNKKKVKKREAPVEMVTPPESVSRLYPEEIRNFPSTSSGVFGGGGGYPRHHNYASPLMQDERILHDSVRRYGTPSTPVDFSTARYSTNGALPPYQPSYLHYRSAVAGPTSGTTSGTGTPTSATGFAHTSLHAYPHHTSTGWLNE